MDTECDVIEAGKDVLRVCFHCTDDDANTLLIHLSERTHDRPSEIALALLDPGSREAMLTLARIDPDSPVGHAP